MGLTVEKWKKMKESAQTVNNNGKTSSSSGSSGGTSGGNKGGGSSGGTSKGGSTSSTSKTNSQYTAPSLGNTYNASTDYQAIINNAVANGDYLTAAKAEQLRNQKITATGSPYNTTNIYAGYLQPDYGTIGQQQMANNASAEDVRDTYNSRYDKAINTPGLEQYANDAIQQQMLDYILKKQAEENQQKAQNESTQWIEDYVQENPKEEFESKYDPQIDALLNEILNRDDFSYDAMNDPLYQQYAAMYQREGDRAMKETLAEAAASAGGMNTYAITAAQQANSYYNSQLNDRIPELYQLAYDMYLNDKESKVQDLGILQNMDTTQYNRYRDTISDWYNDKNFAYNAYQNAVQQGNWQTNFDYNAMLDNRNWNNDQYWANKEWNYNDMWTNKEWDESESDEAYERNQAEKTEAQALIDWYIQNGVTTVDAETLAKAGITQAQFNEMVAYKKQQDALKTKSSSSSSNNNEYSPKKTEEEKKKYEEGKQVVEKLKESDQWDASYNYEAIDNACRELNTTKGKEAALEYLKEKLENGQIDITSYMVLLNKYRNLGTE